MVADLVSPASGGCPSRGRWLLPVGLLLLLWLLMAVALSGLMQDPYRLAGSPLYRPLLNTLSAARFLLLLFSTFFVYPFVWAAGASLRQRVLAAYVLPLAYVLWAIFQATAYFPLGQAVYYGFNPLAFGAFWLQLALIGVAEIAGRAWSRFRHGTRGPLVRWTHIAGIIVGLFALYLTLFWDGGVHWFYVYQEGYKLLFQ